MREQEASSYIARRTVIHGILAALSLVGGSGVGVNIKQRLVEALEKN